ncbi:MAG TPA: hypothetical protein VFZ51_04205 [Woeseiaceae bacterium]
MRRIFFISGIAGLFLAVILLPGCANTIRLGEQPTEVRMVYLLDLGRHTRLAFELTDGNLVEYAYGEWQWYARMEDQWWRVPAVMLWPTQGTLGRWEWPAPRAKARLLDEYAGLIVLELPAEARKVDALIAGLERDFRSRSRELLRNTTYRLDFVPYHRQYWLFNNSNHAVKEWLKELGYEVEGSGIVADWKYGR